MHDTLFHRLRVMPYYSPDEGGGDGTPPAEPPAAPPTPPAGGATPPEPPATPPAGKTFTEAELQAELDRVAAKVRAEEKTKADKQRELDEMTQLERAEASATESEEKLTSVTQELAWVKTESEIRVQALAAGVKPEHLAHVLKLVDLEGISINDEGVVDTVAVKASVDKVLESVPALKTTPVTPTPQAGGDFGGGGPGPKSLDTQIQEAEAAGDWATAGLLKTQKTLELAGKSG